MTPWHRRLLNIVGVCVFVVVLGVAIYDSPPRISEISFSWLALVVIGAVGSIVVQTSQTIIFMRAEGIDCNWRWSAWITSEKAWINTLFPAKAGTAGAVILLRSKFGLAWDRYLKFMFQCGWFAVSASVSGLTFLFLNSLSATFVALMTLVLAALASRIIYKTGVHHTTFQVVLAIVGLLSLTVGLYACIRGLGYHTDFIGIAPAGITLNLLSVVAITPGNFGVREVVLAALAPFLQVSFAEIVQASTYYVFVRMLISLGIASLFRSRLLLDKSQ